MKRAENFSLHSDPLSAAEIDQLRHNMSDALKMHFFRKLKCLSVCCVLATMIVLLTYLKFGDYLQIFAALAFYMMCATVFAIITYEITKEKPAVIFVLISILFSCSWALFHDTQSHADRFWFIMSTFVFSAALVAATIMFARSSRECHRINTTLTDLEDLPRSYCGELVEWKTDPHIASYIGRVADCGRTLIRGEFNAISEHQLKARLAADKQSVYGVDTETFPVIDSGLIVNPNEDPYIDFSIDKPAPVATDIALKRAICSLQYTSVVIRFYASLALFAIVTFGFVVFTGITQNIFLAPISLWIVAIVLLNYRSILKVQTTEKLVAIGGVLSLFYLTFLLTDFQKWTVENFAIHGCAFCIFIVLGKIIAQLERKYEYISNLNTSLKTGANINFDALKKIMELESVSRYVADVASKGRELTVGEYTMLSNVFQEHQNAQQEREDREACQKLYLGMAPSLQQA